MCESLQKLKELTPRLKPPLFGVLEQEDIKQGVKYKIGKGTLLSQGLFKKEGIAVAHSFMSMGSQALPHVHKEKEILIIYEGSIILEVENENTILKVGDVIEINPNVSHSVVDVICDCNLIAITVPADKSFPDAK